MLHITKSLKAHNERPVALGKIPRGALLICLLAHRTMDAMDKEVGIVCKLMYSIDTKFDPRTIV